MTAGPDTVHTLVRLRDEARGRGDYATADDLRARIAEQGWDVTDTAAGAALVRRPGFAVATDVGALPDWSAQPATRRCAGLLLVTGWPHDVTRFVNAWVQHTPDDCPLVALDLGDVSGAGQALHDVADRHAGRVEAWHLAQPLDAVGFGTAMNVLLRLDTSEVQVVADMSSLLVGDAVTVLVDAIVPGVAAAGWRGVNIDRADQWRSLTLAGPGPVDAVLGYLFAARRSSLLAVGGYSSKARLYRNADVELSLLLREAGEQLAVPSDDLPVQQDRHHGYHDSDPVALQRESRRTYERILRRFRGRDELLAQPSPLKGER